MTCLVPEHDDFLRPAQAAERFAIIPQARVIAAPDARHLWVGERFVSTVLNAIVEQVAPQKAPLPSRWSGPMERWSQR